MNIAKVKIRGALAPVATKQKYTFRIDSEVALRFKLICQKNSLSQGVVLERLIQAFLNDLKGK